MAKKLDPLKEKQRKQKILAIVLCVLFVGVLAFTGPKTWKQLHPPAPPSSTETSTTTTTPTGTPTLAAPSLSGGEPNTSGSATGTTSLASGPVVVDGQLASFSRFASKDPFSQQLSEDMGSSSGSSGSSSGSGSTSEPGVPDIPGNEPAPGTAVISLNGTLYSVAVGDDFPEASTTDPTLAALFHLVSLTSHSAKISIVGGSYANGAKTITLKENKATTLMNTADGTRYTLVLKPQGTTVDSEDGSSSSGSGSDSSTTVTLPPATP